MGTSAAAGSGRRIRPRYIASGVRGAPRSDWLLYANGIFYDAEFAREFNSGGLVTQLFIVAGHRYLDPVGCAPNQSRIALGLVMCTTGQSLRPDSVDAIVVVNDHKLASFGQVN